MSSNHSKLELAFCHFCLRSQRIVRNMVNNSHSYCLVFLNLKFSVETCLFSAEAFFQWPCTTNILCVKKASVPLSVCLHFSHWLGITSCRLLKCFECVSEKLIVPSSLLFFQCFEFASNYTPLKGSWLYDYIPHHIALGDIHISGTFFGGWIIRLGSWWIEIAMNPKWWTQNEIWMGISRFHLFSRVPFTQRTKLFSLFYV